MVISLRDSGRHSIGYLMGCGSCEKPRGPFSFLFLPCKCEGPFLCLLVTEFPQPRVCGSVFLRRACSVGPFNQFRGVFLKHCFEFTVFSPQTSYCLAGGPSRRLPRSLFSPFCLSAFFCFAFAWKELFRSVFQPLRHIFHLCF